MTLTVEECVEYWGLLIGANLYSNLINAKSVDVVLVEHKAG